MTASEERPERNPGSYDPAEDPDTDAPTGDAPAREQGEEIPEGQAEPERSEPAPGGPPTAPADPPSAG
jgi:hypothetical protein